MPLTRHSLFSNLPSVFVDTFGEPISFTLAGGDKVLQAIVRQEADELNGGIGGSGTVGDIVYLKLSTADVVHLAQGDTLIHQSIVFKIEFPGRDDGRGMTSFDLARVV